MTWARMKENVGMALSPSNADLYVPAYFRTTRGERGEDTDEN